MKRNGTRGARRTRYNLRRRMYSVRELVGPSIDTRDDAAAMEPGAAGDTAALAASISAEELAALRETIVRQRAEFENFRKRTQREKEQVREIAAESLLTRLLPVLDNLDRAIASAQTAVDVASVRDGVSLIAQQLTRALEAEGLEQVNAAKVPFDPSIHDALATEECADVPDGHVCAVLLPGYTYKTRLLRPAMVKVARKAQQ